MSTVEGGDARDGQPQRDHGDRRGDRIGVGGGDDSVTRIQLAARWAESYGPEADSLGNILKRFRAAYEYLDAVIHGVEPADLERDLAESPAGHQPVAAPAYAGSSNPPPPESPPPPPPPESRPW